MIKEEINIAIAEACGWKDIRPPDELITVPMGSNPDPDPDEGYEAIPSYTTDLNAMHEAEKQALNRHTCHSFFDTLGLIAIKDWQDCDGSPSYEGDGSYFEMWVIESATALQRAEAFLRTLGKWKD